MTNDEGDNGKVSIPIWNEILVSSPWDYCGFKMFFASKWRLLINDIKYEHITEALIGQYDYFPY